MMPARYGWALIRIRRTAIIKPRECSGCRLEERSTEFSVSPKHWINFSRHERVLECYKGRDVTSGLEVMEDQNTCSSDTVAWCEGFFLNLLLRIVTSPFLNQVIPPIVDWLSSLGFLVP